MHRKKKEVEQAAHDALRQSSSKTAHAGVSDKDIHKERKEVEKQKNEQDVSAVQQRIVGESV